MYLIYNIESTLIKRPNFYHPGYKTKAAAKSAMTRQGLSDTSYAVAEKDYFHNSIEKQETKKNLLGGKEFTQPVNTPSCCDPSTETYHSM